MTGVHNPMVDLPGNTTTTAAFQGDVQTAASYSGSFERLGDSDWIRLDLVAGTAYRFFGRDLDTAGVSGGADLRLFDADGVEIARGGSNGSLGTLSFTATTSGTFFIGVKDLHGARGDYTVDVVGSNFHGAVVIGDEVIDEGADPGLRFTSGNPGDDVIDYIDFVMAADDTIFGGAGDDTIYAGSNWVNPKDGTSDGDNTVHGGGGADRIFGGYRTDTIHGDDGNDEIDGGFGDDSLWGDAGNDTISGSYGHDVLNGGVGNDTLLGGYGHDSLTGGDGNDTLDGGTGDDSLSGGAGADKMHGGDGNDTYYVDNARDVVNETVANGLDKVYASVSFNLSDAYHCKGKAETLVLTNTNDIDGTGNAVANQIFGNAGSNMLRGLAGNDSLDGRGGNDILIGGAGADRLTGGLGADRFVLAAAPDSAVSADSRDTILDFSHAQGDRIDLEEIDANSVASGNQAFRFLGSAAFTHHAGELRYQAVSGSLYLYGDLNGDGAADFSIKVEHLTSIQASDFIL